MSAEPLPDVWYALCPDCEGECDGCTTCWDELTPHVCEAG
jgi:hypothetical protein